MLNSLPNGFHKELDDEEGRQVEAEGLVVGGGELADGSHSLAVRVNEESSSVQESGSVQDVLQMKS